MRRPRLLVHLFLMLGWLGLASGVQLGLARDAQAGSIGIDFDFTSSTIDILGGAVVIPPEGTLTAASAGATLNGSGPASAESGGVTLDFLTLFATVNGSVLGNVITGSVGAAMVGNPTGSLSPGLGNVFFPGGLVMNVTGMLDCSGANCATLGPFPITFSGPQTFSPVGTVPVGNVNSVGNATVALPLTLSLDGFSAVIDLVGVEVNRSFVPDPTTTSTTSTTTTSTTTPTPTTTETPTTTVTVTSTTVAPTTTTTAVGSAGKKKSKAAKKNKKGATGKKLKTKKQKRPKKLSKKLK